MSTTDHLRAQRPAEVGYARILAIVAVLLWIPIAGAALRPAMNASPFVGALMFLFVFGAFGVVKGRKSRRTMSVVGCVGLMLTLLPYSWQAFRDPVQMFPAGYAALDIGAALLAAGAVALMFRPQVNAYIDAVTAVMRGTKAD